ALLNGALEKIDDLAIVSKEAADYIRKEKNNPSTIDFLTKKLTYLELCIIMLISYNKNCVIHFYKYTDGEFMIFSELFEDELSKNPENLKSYLNQIQKTHLSVSLNEILSQFIKVDDNGEKIFTSQLLSKDEYKIIQHIRNKSKDIKSISIKLIDGKPYRIDIKKEKKVSIESKILSLIKSKSYSKIELEIENGNIVFSCNTEKIKL
ncbi:MAG: hypothetical protein HOK72_06255, partial [Flavobacteriales bacterium]|nr:hypothetical protein [Flavobacteriales bacterium]